jgi:hypothetical protein
MLSDRIAPTIGAYAIVRGEEPRIVLAENAAVISRALALTLAAQLPADQISSRARLKRIRSALLEERWGDALVEWIDETGTAVDVYEEAPKVWSEHDLDLDGASLEIRLAPIFS